MNSRPRIIFSDFDGTLTDHTSFSSLFLDILKFSNLKKIPFVIVTGRSLSWAHFFLTHFPTLDYVISEGGGVLSFRDNRGLIVNEFLVDDREIKRLEKCVDELSQSYSSINLSADSIGRVTDRAIELCDLDNEILRDEVKIFLDKHKINFSTSNVHLNFWAGDISKYKAVTHLLEKYLLDYSIEESIYFGDSLNDQSMFKNVEHSVGVSNINDVIDQLEFLPKIILKGEENKGPQGVLTYLKGLF